MRAIIQRVTKASVEVGGEIISSIGKGICVLVGFTHADSLNDIDYISRKLINLRIFDDDNNNLNKSVKDIEGEILLVPQFTLYGDARKGNRPSFSNSMKPDQALKIYNQFVEYMKEKYDKIQTGKFQAYMKINIVNDGPVTIILDSNKII